MRCFFALMILGLTLIGGCKQEQIQSPAKPQTTVDVMVIQPTKIMLTTELPGRTTAYLVAEVRPQIDGIILKRLFDEGSDVQMGQPLYQIDDRRYKAILDNSQGTLQRAKASLTTTQLKVKRYKELVTSQAVSRQDYDDALAAYQSNEADVFASQAAVEIARINVDYCQIKSPITGRIGRSALTEGALAVTNQTLPLTTVQQLDPIYVDISQSSLDLLHLKRDMKQGLYTATNTGRPKVQLILEDGTLYDQTGILEFSDISVDQGTGAVTVRARFPNKDQTLLPGMYVRAILIKGQRDQAILVPQNTVTYDRLGHATALVVGSDNRVEKRELMVEQAFQNNWLINQGLQAGDRLILSGGQKIKPGDVVQPNVMTAVTPQSHPVTLPTNIQQK